MILYVNGQDIAHFILGAVQGRDDAWSWAIAPQRFEVGPEQYLATLDAFLSAAQLTPDDIEGVVLIQGPGSPTALRGVHALINTLAFTRSWLVYSLEKDKETADEGILQELARVAARPYALPAYGADPHITKSNKDALKRVVPHGK